MRGGDTNPGGVAHRVQQIVRQGGKLRIKARYRQSHVAQPWIWIF
jgi:hypothetical protein